MPMAAFSGLVNTSIIIFTNVYHDENNGEIHFISSRYDNDLSKVTYSTSISPIDNLPGFFQGISREKKETHINYASLNELLGFECDVEKGRLFCMSPFYYENKMIGMISLLTEHPVDLINRFNASYWVLNNLFLNQYKNKVSTVKLDTYQIVLDLMPQRVFWKNRTSNYLGCNKAFATDASYDRPEDLIGLSDYDTFPEQAELYRSDDARTMETRQHMIASEEPQTQKNGKTIWLRTSKRPIITENNVVVGMVGTYDDITLLKETQQQLSRAKSELEVRVEERTEQLSSSNLQLEQAIQDLKTTQNQLIEKEKMSALGRLVAGVAHEINTPLGIALTSSSLLASQSNDLESALLNGSISKTKFHEICSVINEGSELISNNLHRASELISNFKMVAVDQSYDNKRKIVLQHYIRDVVNAMTPKTKEKNIKVFVSGLDEVEIYTYPGSLSQILTNLIDNAVLHAFSNVDSGEINIQYAIVDQQIELIFEDDGEGIDEDMLSKIFEPFYTSKLGSGGTGLGLSIVYNIITQRLNGHIRCESQINKGTRFTVSIPM